MSRILVTGPVAGIDRYQAAAEGAGWDAVALPLLAVEPRDADLGAAVLALSSGARPDWICITSSNALHALETLPEAWRDIPLAVVGRRTLELVRALELPVALGPAASAKELAMELRLRHSAGGRVLWPRGNLGTELADELRDAGFEVVDPVVYETSANLEITELPEAEAVFLASPSAVQRFAELDGPRPDVGIAIGPTTSDAIGELAEEAPLFKRSLCLSEPSPAGLRSALESIGLDG